VFFHVICVNKLVAENLITLKRRSDKKIIILLWGKVSPGVKAYERRWGSKRTEHTISLVQKVFHDIDTFCYNMNNFTNVSCPKANARISKQTL